MRAILALFACALVSSASPAIDESRIVDLTHTFDEDTVHWPTAKPFRWEKDSWGRNAAGEWYASASFSASEHLGTHLDSPVHFAEGQTGTDGIAIERLIGPAVVIDVTKAAGANADYRLSPSDLKAWEQAHGTIPRGAIVIARTGWFRRWPDRKRYMGTAEPGNVRDLHFPGIHPDAARMLVERGVDGVGIDTASLDHGPSVDFQTHRILSAAGIYGLENLAAVDRLPPSGATIIALPMKIRNGTGGPVRVIAVLP